MSAKVGPANHERSAVPIPLLVRAVAYAIAWVPFLALIVVFEVKFEPLFCELDAMGELPALTKLTLCISWMCQDFAYVPFVVGFGILMLADVGVASCLRRLQCSPGFFILWFIGVIAMAVLAAHIVFVAMLLPVFLMKGPV